MIKEWKSSAIWMLTGLILVTAGMTATLYWGDYHSLTAYWESVTRSLMLGAPLVAVLIGALQIVPERRRDLWAFVMHRPASKAMLFGGKAIAGLSLYAAATVIPLLGAAAWAAIPGNVDGPFDWGLTLGGFGAILFGCPFYFAVMFITLRPARWYGSAILPIVAPIALAWFNSAALFTEWWQAVSVSLIAGTTYAMAAYGLFQGDNSQERTPKISRFAAGVVLLGCIIILTMPVSMQSNSNGYDGSQWIETGNSQQYLISNTGELLRKTTTEGKPDVFEAIADSQGRLIKRAPVSRISSGIQLQSIMEAPFRSYIDPYTSSERYAARVGVAPSHTFGQQNWYLDRTRGQFLAYSRKSRRLVGILGPNGYYQSGQSGPASLEARAGHFTPGNDTPDIVGTGGIIVLGGSKLYLVSIADQQVRLLDAGIDAGDVSQVINLSQPSTAGAGIKTDTRSAAVPAFLLASSENVHIFSSDGRRLLTVHRQLSRKQYPTVSMAVTSSPLRVLSLYETAPSTQSKPPRYIVIDDRGRHLNNIEVPAQHSSDLVEVPQKQHRIHLEGLAVPMAYPVFVLILALLFMPHGLSSADVTMVLNRSHLFFSEILVSALICGILGYLIARRCALPKRSCKAWAIGTFFLGLPGIALMLAYRGWPVRVPCPSCKRKRPIAQEFCEHCGEPFPAPRMDGTEIFGDSDSLQTEFDSGNSGLMMPAKEVTR